MEVKWVPKEGRRNILTLVVDGDPIRDVHVTIFGRYPKLPSSTTLEELETFIHSIEYKGAKNYAIKRLSLKNQPSTEMDKALKERLVSQNNRDKIIEEFSKLGYLNDEEWITGFVRSQTNKQIGPKTIYQKLKAKGLPDESIAQILENNTSPEKQLTQIHHLLKTKYKTRDITDYKQKQKVIASLIRKGFDFEQVRQVLDDMDSMD